jgi:hypothetical protein
MVPTSSVDGGLHSGPLQQKRVTRLSLFSKHVSQNADTAFKNRSKGRQLMSQLFHFPVTDLSDEIQYLSVSRHAEHLKIEALPRQRDDDPGTAGTKV